MFQQEGADKEVVGDLSRWEPSFWSAVASAVNKTGAAVALGAAALLFLIVAMIWHSPAGFFFFPVAVAGIGLAHAGRPAFWARLKAARATGMLELPDPRVLSDDAAQRALRRLHEARAKRLRAQTRSPFGRAHALSHSDAALRELDRRALILIARVEHIGRLLSDAEGERPDTRIERLRAARGAAWTSQTEQTYERAASVATAHREMIQRLEGRRRHGLAELEHVLGVIEALPAKLTEVDLARVDACDEAIEETLVDATTFLTEIDAISTMER
jgi:hypothetical protein